MGAISTVPPLRKYVRNGEKDEKTKNKKRNKKCLQAEILLNLSWHISAPKWKEKTKKSIPQLTSLCIKDFKQRVVLPTNLSAGAGGRPWWGPLSNQRTCHCHFGVSRCQEQYPGRGGSCSVLLTGCTHCHPPLLPPALLFVSLQAACIPSGTGTCHFSFPSRGASDLGERERMTRAC